MHTVSIRGPEIDKYRRVWRDVPAYRSVSPGEQMIGALLMLTGVQPGARVVDVGCGTGRTGVKLTELLMRVTLVDAIAEARDVAAQGLPFVEACLWDDWPAAIGPQDLAVCCDVLEHIPEPLVLPVVLRCLQAAPVAYLQVSHDADRGGAAIGETLHVTCRPHAWWRDHLAEVSDLVEARDLLGVGVYVAHRRAAW